MACSCNGSRVAPLTDYISNRTYQELIDVEDYWEVASNERKYLDLRVALATQQRLKNLKRTTRKLPFTSCLKIQQQKS